MIPKRPLSELVHIDRNAVQPESIADGTRYVGLDCIETGGRILRVDKVSAGELASSKFAFDDRHILFGKLRPNLAKVARPEFSGICSTDILPIRPRSDVDRAYLAHYLRSPEAVSWATSRTSGANLPRLSPAVLGTLPVPLPPLPEQRRIASVLDEAESIRAMRQKSIELLGQVTDVLFERPKENDQDWGPIVRLGDVFDVSGGKRLPKGALYASSPTDHPYLRVVDMKSGTFAMDGLKYLTSDVHSKISRYVVKSGDLVISIAGTIGSVAVVPSMLDGANLTENAARLRPRAGVMIDPHFVRAQLASRAVQDQIDRATGRVTIGKLALFRIEDLQFRLPPLPLQREMARQLQQIDTQRSRLARHLDVSIEVCETLKTQAFRGEL